jgi:hypothetical protein
LECFTTSEELGCGGVTRRAGTLRRKHAEIGAEEGTWTPMPCGASNSSRSPVFHPTLRGILLSILRRLRYCTCVPSNLSCGRRWTCGPPGTLRVSRGAGGLGRLGPIWVAVWQFEIAAAEVVYDPVFGSTAPTGFHCCRQSRHFRTDFLPRRAHWRLATTDSDQSETTIVTGPCRYPNHLFREACPALPEVIYFLHVAWLLHFCLKRD